MALIDCINSETGEIRPIEQSVFEGWIANNNPKALVWSIYIKPPDAPPVVVVPASVTRKQLLAQLYLDHAITYEQIEAKIRDITPAGSPQRYLAELDLEDSLTFERASPLVGMLAPLFDLSPTQVDALFIAAATRT